MINRRFHLLNLDGALMLIEEHSGINWQRLPRTNLLDGALAAV